MKIHRTPPQEARQLSNLLSLIQYLNEGGVLYKAADALDQNFPSEHEPILEIGAAEFADALLADEEEHVSDRVNYFCRQALAQILEIKENTNPTTAALNLEILLDPKNQIVDETKSYLDFHPRLMELEKDKQRLDWLASLDNKTGHVMLPTECVAANPHDLRAAIDAAMAQEQQENQNEQ